MMRNVLLSSIGGALAFGLFATSAQAAPGQFLRLDTSPQTNNDLLTLVRHGGGGWGGHGGGHWRGGGHWGGGGRFAHGGWNGGGFRHGFRGRGFGFYGLPYYDYGSYYGYGCFWRYGRRICPGYGGYGYY